MVNFPPLFVKRIVVEKDNFPENGQAMLSQKNSSKTVAAFDFDGTISYCDTLIPFLWSITGTWRTAKNLLKDLPFFTSYLLGKKTRQETKERILTQFLQGECMEKIQQKGAHFSAQILPKLLKKKALERIWWHRSQGHSLILISANLDVYLKPWAFNNGFTHLVASQLALDAQGKISGKLQGKNCWGAEKTRRLLELLGPKENFTLYAYGDSRGDRELLELADYSFYRTLG